MSPRCRMIVLPVGLLHCSSIRALRRTRNIAYRRASRILPGVPGAAIGLPRYRHLAIGIGLIPPVRPVWRTGNRSGRSTWRILPDGWVRGARNLHFGRSRSRLTSGVGSLWGTRNGSTSAGVVVDRSTICWARARAVGNVHSLCAAVISIRRSRHISRRRHRIDSTGINRLGLICGRPVGYVRDGAFRNFPHRAAPIPNIGSQLALGSGIQRSARPGSKRLLLRRKWKRSWRRGEPRHHIPTLHVGWR
jgi:hypothetical protein